MPLNSAVSTVRKLLNAFFVLIVVFLPLTNATSLGADIVDTWRYVLRKPADGWQAVDFDAADWKEANGGFGTRDTPGSRVGTTWATNNIWLRKSFSLDQVPAKPALLIHHDEGAEVYINGQQVAALKGYTVEFKVVPLNEDQAKALKTGSNVMAVHCRQTGGGQFIDVHLVDADNLPQLPPAKRDTKPFESELITTWGADVNAENAWTEYPRPQMQRKDWTNLNGDWDYAITPREQVQSPNEWAGKILVPFCLESKLGGVQRLLDATETLWYHRAFQAKKSDGNTLLLNFEAVDYRCEVIVNGQSVGKHQGGNTPFSLDITAAVQDGDNDLVVRVDDDTEGYQLRGKQTLNARGIWYTQVSGIWQTVWLEQVSDSHVVDLRINTSAKDGTITVHPTVEGEADVDTVHVSFKDPVTGESVALQRKMSDTENVLQITIENPKLWSPSSPNL